MRYDVTLQAEAVNDIQIAFEWYEEKKTGLGHSFIDEINTCFEKLRNNPLQFGLYNKWIRKVQLNRFPFLIVFEVENNFVFVNAVRHTSRMPKM